MGEKLFEKLFESIPADFFTLSCRSENGIKRYHNVTKELRIHSNYINRNVEGKKKHLYILIHNFQSYY